TVLAWSSWRTQGNGSARAWPTSQRLSTRSCSSSVEVCRSRDIFSWTRLAEPLRVISPVVATVPRPVWWRPRWATRRVWSARPTWSGMLYRPGVGDGIGLYWGALALHGG